jgi:hypothetical protein
MAKGRVQGRLIATAPVQGQLIATAPVQSRLMVKGRVHDKRTVMTVVLLARGLRLARGTLRTPVAPGRVGEPRQVAQLISRSSARTHS